MIRFITSLDGRNLLVGSCGFSKWGYVGSGAATFFAGVIAATSSVAGRFWGDAVEPAELVDASADAFFLTGMASAALCLDAQTPEPPNSGAEARAETLADKHNGLAWPMGVLSKAPHLTDV
jgi:hypothetical protein